MAEIKENIFPFNFAKRHGVLIKSWEQDHAKVIIRNKLSLPVLAEVRRFVGLPIDLELVDEEFFNNELSISYQNNLDQAQKIVEDLGEGQDLLSIAEAIPETDDLLDQEEDAPIIRLINALLTEAIKEKASDIHIETFEHNLIVRFRVDGVLRKVVEPNRALAPLLVSRIKVMAKLDIAEKRLPQDGRISVRVAGHEIDIRVSVIPANDGERVVLRILDKQASTLDLKSLGMSERDFKLIGNIINKPHGIILVTGPTGSGKTTTLYASLVELNNLTKNILTVEDPIEYNLDGIGQTQVNSKIDMTFSRGLRSILRQDPDIIMVGEIRDKETAEIAVRASLTGHLVLSTLHTNTAIGAITRLNDIGIEPFLLSSSLVALVSQRLVRKLCDDCKIPYSVDHAECSFLNIDPNSGQKIYRPNGCDSCNNSGYAGRTGIYEVVEIDEQIRSLIHENKGEQVLEKYIRTKTPSIEQDGADKIISGITSIEEVVRVTKEN